MRILLLILIVMAGPSNAASLIGEPVDMVSHNYGTTGEFSGSLFDSSVVGTGIEFIAIEPELVDISAVSIQYQQGCTSEILPCTGFPAGPGATVFGPIEFDEVILTFTSGNVVITDAILVSGHGVVNLTQSAVTFDSNMVSIVMAGVEWSAHDIVNIDLEFTVIPEPSAALLLGLGLAALAFYRGQSLVGLVGLAVEAPSGGCLLRRNGVSL